MPPGPTGRIVAFFHGLGLKQLFENVESLNAIEAKADSKFVGLTFPPTGFEDAPLTGAVGQSRSFFWFNNPLDLLPMPSCSARNGFRTWVEFNTPTSYTDWGPLLGFLWTGDAA
jgi:hypothetical protein